MTLSTNTISVSNVNIEIGRSANATTSFNEILFRTVAQTGYDRSNPGTQISLNLVRGQAIARNFINLDFPPDGYRRTVRFPTKSTWTVPPDYSNGDIDGPFLGTILPGEAAYFISTRRAMWSSNNIIVLANVLGNSKIYWSSSGGSNGSWQMANTSSNTNFTKACINGNNIVYVLSNTDGIQYMSYATMPTPNVATLISTLSIRPAAITYHPGFGFVMVGQNESGETSTYRFMYSTDNGATWTGNNNLNANGLRGIASGGGRLVAISRSRNYGTLGAGTDNPGQIYLSDDNGSTWSNVAYPTVLESEFRDVAYLGNDTFIAYSSKKILQGSSWASTNVLYRSTDRGSTWTALGISNYSQSHIFLVGLPFTDYKGNCVINCSYNSFGSSHTNYQLVSTDRGATWSAVNAGFREFIAAQQVTGQANRLYNGMSNTSIYINGNAWYWT